MFLLLNDGTINSPRYLYFPIIQINFKSDFSNTQKFALTALSNAPRSTEPPPRSFSSHSPAHPPSLIHMLPLLTKDFPSPEVSLARNISLQIHLGQYPSSRIQPLKSIKTATQLILFHFQSVQLFGEADHEEHVDSSSGGAQGDGEQ